MIFLDTETCGLHGMPVLLQYAKDEGDVVLYNIWQEPINDTLELFEEIANNDICGFNLAFDWFHIYKCWATFSLYPNHEAIPEDIIPELVDYEDRSRDFPFCLKPKSALDLMLHSRKGPYQSLMERSDIRIKRVPTRLAEPLREELEKRVELDGIYFARRKDKFAPKWQIRDVTLPNGDINPEFKDIVLKFNASGALKVLAEHALGIKEDAILKYSNVEVPEVFRPLDLGYAPFAKAMKAGAWPDVIHHHIRHWAYNEIARRYATNDVIYTRGLYHYFGDPESGDTDSELACMVGATRWRGFKINVAQLREQRKVSLLKKGKAPTAPNAVKAYLSEVMNDTEKIVLNEGTKRTVLEELAKWESNPLVAQRAQEVLDARMSDKEIELYDKLLKAGRFHASFKIIGALSTRMSGSDGLNPQGIKHTEEVRACFPLAFDNHILCGGDFESFEVSISEAVYKDPKLREDLLRDIDCPKCNGKGCSDCKNGKTKLKIHALFAEELFPGYSYDDIVKSAKTSNDLYDKGKKGIFAMNYGGNAKTLEERLGVSEQAANDAYENFAKRYPGIGKARDKIKEQFCSMTQPNGIGSAVIWKEPADYIESLLGFRRYFTLENRICKTLFELAQNPPKNWKYVKVQVKRRDRVQTASGAAQSALYASAFTIQSSNMRAAANHQIQSTGAGITKELQRKIWDIQPHGAFKWLVTPLNIHDEIMCPVDPEVAEKVESIVNETVESYRPLIPLIGMEWKKNIPNWSKK